VSQKANPIVSRLRSAEGHLRGIQEMVEKDAYCIDIVRQTQAVQAALSRVNALLLERHLTHCVSRAMRSSDRSERDRVVSELIDLFGRELRP
jgi:DNA-binding FrmR family transcriptional regulator